MKRLIDTFSIRSTPVFATAADGVIADSFSARLQEHHTETANEVITGRFNAGVQLFHVPEGDAEAFRSFSVAPSGYDVFGEPTPEHHEIITDILRYRTNG